MKILIVSHGNFSKGLIDTSEMIIGGNESVNYMMLNSSDSVDEFYEKIEQFVSKTKDDILILADLIGGSPMLSSARVMVSRPDVRIGIVTGVNLPMLLEVVSQLNMGVNNFDELILLAETVGKEGIKILRQKGGEENGSSDFQGR